MTFGACPYHLKVFWLEGTSTHKYMMTFGLHTHHPNNFHEIESFSFLLKHNGNLDLTSNWHPQINFIGKGLTKMSLATMN
jgi:hypothetical protein